MTENKYSLAHLQAMTKEDLERFFPQRNAKWVRLGYKVDITRLIKAIIYATKELHWSLTDNRGCREVWYNPVKPILLKAEGRRIENPKSNYMRLFEETLSEMVKARELTYADLGINEFRTLRELYEDVEKAECWKNIILFIEKDGAYVHLKPLQNLFNITIMSGSGWSNTAGIEKMLRNLTEKGISEVVVFTLTDYDPFGFAISKEFVDKCETLGLYVTEHHRIGINPKHATPEILDVQKYPVKRGRRLTVNGVSFNSDRWLAEYGVERAYGLEIEAVSAQVGGHQFLRQIVAKELLAYLKETDRVEEITKTAWENAPFRAIQEIMRLIDNAWIDRNIIQTKPETLPDQYLSYDEYREKYNEVFEEMESETEEIDSQIDIFEERLGELEDQKAQLEGPYRNTLDRLEANYILSKHILSYCLHQYYLKNREKWQRQDYTLGYPNGCIENAVKDNIDLPRFLKQIDTSKIDKDITTILIDAYNNGELARLISDVMKGGFKNE